MSGEMLSYPGGWDKPIPEVNHPWLCRTSTPNNLDKGCLICVLHIFCTFVDKNEENNHHIEGGSREFHYLQHPGICMPRRWLQILDTRMGFPHPSLNVVIDYKNLPRLCTGTGISTRVSKICSPRRGLQSHVSCKLTRVDFPVLVQSSGWLFFSYHFQSLLKDPLFAIKKFFKRFRVSKWRQLG